MPTVLVGREGASKSERSGSGGRREDAERAWHWVGWFAVALGLAGASDLVLAWIPLQLGNPQWEFATVAQSMSGLPLVTIGLAGVLGSGIARRRTRWIVVSATVLAIVALAIAAALWLFWPNAGLALDQSSGTAAIGVRRTIAKTLFLGLTFGTACTVGAIAAFRHVLRMREG